MRSISGVGRIAAIGAVVIAVGLVAYLLLGQSYTVVANFQNAGQLVKGSPVQIGGQQVGKVGDIQLAPNSTVYVTMTLKGPHVPLPVGTKAEIKQLSLSSIAGRYVDLSPPTAPAVAQHQPSIPDGGQLPIQNTLTAVDVDQLFDTLDPTMRASIQDFIKGSAKQWTGKGLEANRGLQYLNPTLSTSRRLFNELTSDKVLLRRFVDDSARFMTTVAERRADLAGAVRNLNTTMGAIASQKAALQESIARLPGFMRTADTTFVNVRSTLDDLDPLVNASKPVAPKLEHLLRDLRPFAHDARPTIIDLDNIVRRPGPNNDLVELDRTFPPLARIALDTRRRSMAPGGRAFNVGTVRGAFPEMTQALTNSVTGTDGRGGRLGPIPTLRPYTPDLFGWFDDFSTTGAYDALGGISRTQVYLNNLDHLSVASGVLGQAPIPLRNLVPGLQNLPTASQNEQAIRKHQARRCPGGAESPAPDGSNVLSPSQQAALDCRDSDRATKPN